MRRPSTRIGGSPAVRPPVANPALRLGRPGDADERAADRAASAFARVAGRRGAAAALADSLHPGSSGASEASSEVGSIVAAGLSGAGRALAADTRRTFEQGFGRDFSRVRIHADREADAAAHALGTTAFALGADVAFAAGRYEPHTARGRHVLAHELAHVAQSSAAGAAGVVRRLPPPDRPPTSRPRRPPRPPRRPHRRRRPRRSRSRRRSVPAA